ncbi:GNAT family N-acetyltransferase [Dactylosporangium sp. NPDC048998]|uniref:GNAT family N-acetyltransferase n=1 Tax=Dactylosporangium sp. NPDC048998 TaxID=3363976 RepID=UPI003715C5BF
MIQVRVAHSDELPHLVTYEGDTERNAATAGYLAGLLESGCTRPQWCLVAERGGRVTGSVVLWTFPGHDIPMDIVLFEAADETVAAGLLAEAGTLAHRLGATAQGHVLDLPAQAPQFQRRPDFREKVLAEAGFAPTRDGCRFRWTAQTPLPPQDPRLTWRSLAELGNKPFIDMLEDLLAETKDALLLALVADHGPRGAAEQLWTDSARYEHQPEWYEIGYDGEGNAVAVSLPARNAAFPIIGFVGVLPGHRGRGYATAVVARGTHVLAADGATDIRGDCDASNIGIFKAFERAGYKNFVNRRTFGRTL